MNIDDIDFEYNEAGNAIVTRADVRELKQAIQAFYLSKLPEEEDKKRLANSGRLFGENEIDIAQRLNFADGYNQCLKEVKIALGGGE